LKKVIPDLESWQILIQATDINPHFLEKARQGVYSHWSFRGAPWWLKSRYFAKTADGRWELSHDIRSMVQFTHHNLAEDPFPRPVDMGQVLDLVVCRNVLMYFTAEKGKDVIRNFYHCLGKGGWLIISPWEAPSILGPGFQAVRFPGAVLYRKTDGGPGAGDLDFTVTEHGNLSSKILTSKGRGVTREPMEKGEINKFRSASAYQFNSRPPTPDPRPMASDLRAPGPVSQEDLARHYANMGRLPEARQCCQKAIAGDQFNPSLYYLMASILQEQGQGEGAVKFFKKALYLDQDFVLAHFALGNLTAVLGKQRDAEKYFSNALLLLNKFNKEEVLPGSEGITAGSLYEIITSLRRKDGHGQ
jgi:chemotaxis protein methyltransferase CheR